ncbi:MAG: copper amine oxidase domain-containing protein [Parcubacteria group bacterium Gr01-1014_56]|nr:MAG: copper amine oxidase domain-containing protein [Parcubacteria group bacterium Gr01-1014_56]
MKSWLFFVFVCAFTVPSLASAAPLKSTLEISGWMPYWRTATSTQDVLPHLDSLTTVHPFGYTLTEEGILFDALVIHDEPWPSFIAAARAKRVRVIPTVMSGNGELLHKLLSNYESRIKLEDDITALVMENNFDGIDIDFEAKLVETKPYFSLFLKGLYQRMGKKWVYCTIESRTPISSRYPNGNAPADAGVYSNDYVAINKYCDRVQLMVYDQGQVDRKLSAAATGPYAPVADPLWAKKVVTLAAQTISKRKLVLGVPTYGYEWAVTPLLEKGYEYDLLWSFNPRYALEFAASHGLVPERNIAGELSFTYSPSMPTSTPMTLGVPTAATAVGPALAERQPFNIMWWSDSISVAQKIGIAKELGIRGVAIFKFDGGEDQRIWDVLK